MQVLEKGGARRHHRGPVSLDLYRDNGEVLRGEEMGGWAEGCRAPVGRRGLGGMDPRAAFVPRLPFAVVSRPFRPKRVGS